MGESNVLITEAVLARSEPSSISSGHLTLENTLGFVAECFCWLARLLEASIFGKCELLLARGVVQEKTPSILRHI